MLASLYISSSRIDSWASKHEYFSARNVREGHPRVSLAVTLSDYAGDYLLDPAIMVGIIGVPLLLWPDTSTYRIGAAKKRGHCASCGSSLRSKCIDDKGLVTCPECGAAWRLPKPPSVDANA